MTTFTIHSEDKEQSTTIKAILKALKVNFEVKTEKTQYNKEFIAKIKESKKQAKEGKYKVIKTEDLWK